MPGKCKFAGLIYFPFSHSDHICAIMMWCNNIIYSEWVFTSWFESERCMKYANCVIFNESVVEEQFRGRKYDNSSEDVE